MNRSGVGSKVGEVKSVEPNPHPTDARQVENEGVGRLLPLTGQAKLIKHGQHAAVHKNNVKSDVRAKKCSPTTSCFSPRQASPARWDQHNPSRRAVAHVDRFLPYPRRASGQVKTQRTVTREVGRLGYSYPIPAEITALAS